MGRPVNYRAAQICGVLGTILIFTGWRDLGITALIIAVLNYVLYRRENDWVII